MKPVWQADGTDEGTRSSGGYLHEFLTLSLHEKRMIILTFRPLFLHGTRARSILVRRVGGPKSRA